jgi:release factor glutamine methyltransferase
VTAPGHGPTAAGGQELYAEQLAELVAGWRALPDKPEETPTSTLRALWFAAAGASRSAVAAAAGELPVLDAEASERMRALVRSRTSGEPLAYLTGWQHFLGLELMTDAGVLIPRSETELLARVALEAVQARVAERGAAIVVDVCTGSGNVALAIGAHARAARVYAADLSHTAVALARRNAARLELSDRVTFAVGDLFEPLAGAGLDGTVDVVTCNPPYVSSGKVPRMDDEIARFEPALAFDGGPLGFEIIMRAVTDSRALLRADGLLCVEVGAGQAQFVARRVARHDAYRDVRVVADARGEPRVVTAVRTEARATQ